MTSSATPAPVHPPRIPPLAPDERDEQARGLVEEFAFGPTQNIYATLARHPEVMAVCMPVGRRLRAGSLTVRDRELVILRTGVNCRSRYELAQHAFVAREAGFTEDDLRRVAAGPDAGGWTTAETALLWVVDELHESSAVTDATWAALVGRFDEHQVMEVILLVGYYHMISFFLNATGVPLEEGAKDFPGWPALLS